MPKGEKYSTLQLVLFGFDMEYAKKNGIEK